MTQARRPAVVFHGGSHAVLLPATDLSPACFLAAFHTVEGGNYQNFLLKFACTRPWDVLRVSRPLPLVEAAPDASVQQPLAFLSGLALLNGSLVVLTYGSSNVESRVLVLDTALLESIFSE